MNTTDHRQRGTDPPFLRSLHTAPHDRLASTLVRQKGNAA
jgi:hypothetical protein